MYSMMSERVIKTLRLFFPLPRWKFHPAHVLENNVQGDMEAPQLTPCPGLKLQKGLE